LPGAADWTRVLHLVLGTMLAAGGTLALNQYIERDVDARMARTRLRPLPDGRLMPLEALLFGSALTGLGLVYLAACVNVRAALAFVVAGVRQARARSISTARWVLFASLLYLPVLLALLAFDKA